MKQYIHILFLAVISSAFFTSCENKGNKEFLDDYDSILYFLRDGEQGLVLYRLGEPTVEPINVTKAGYDLTATATAKIEMLSQSELDEYNTDNGTLYKVLPQEYYKMLFDPTIQFSNDETYKNIDIQYETDKIDLITDLKSYVLPLKLTSSNVIVNPKKDIVLIKPRVEDPLLYFDNTGTNKITINDGTQSVLEYKVEVKHNFKNKWNFFATVGINDALLDEFNQTNGVNYLMLPQDAYEIKKDGRIDFQEKINYGNLELAIDGSKITYGNYLLPLSILDVSKDKIIIDPNRKDNVYVVNYAPAEGKLSKINLTVDMLSSNAVEPSEGSLANLLDGNVETYFHSAWSVAVDGDHYLQVTLPNEVSAFSFEFTTRHNNSGGNPAKIILQGSANGVNFFNIETIDKDFPTGTAQIYKSSVIVTPKTKYVRLVVPTNRGGGKYFTMSEFSMKGLQ